MTSEVFNTDCLEYMRTLPDKAFQEAIATNLINLAMKGDTKAAQYIQNIQMRAKVMNIRAPFTQGGGLRRGCGVKMAA